MSRLHELALLTAGLVLAGGAQADELHMQRQVPADAHGQVVIDNVAGSIVVSGWDRPQVAVNAQSGADGLSLKVSSEPGRTQVRIEGYENHKGSHDFLRSLLDDVHREARLRVWVPKDSQLSVTGVSADIRATGVTGTQHVQAVDGDIDTELFTALVDVRTVSGDIRLQGHRQAAQVSATSISGNVVLKDGAGDLTATSISGDLHLAIDPADAVRVRTTSGNIEIEGALARTAMLELNTVSGRIDLQTAAPDGFNYDISSFSGDIDDCFGQEATHASQYGPATRLSGARGSGAGTVRVRTLSGDVSICDRAAHHP